MVRGCGCRLRRLRRPVRSAEARSHQPSACRYRRGHVRRDQKPACSKVAALSLLALNGLEERFKIAFPKAAAAFALDNLEEKCRPVFYRSSEDLQHVAFI